MRRNQKLKNQNHQKKNVREIKMGRLTSREKEIFNLSVSLGWKIGIIMVAPKGYGMSELEEYKKD